MTRRAGWAIDWVCVARVASSGMASLLPSAEPLLRRLGASGRAAGARVAPLVGSQHAVVVRIHLVEPLFGGALCPLDRALDILGPSEVAALCRLGAGSCRRR